MVVSSPEERLHLYETALNEQKKYPADGSTLILGAQTHIQLDPGFNKLAGTVMLAAGEAHFDYPPAGLPFYRRNDAARVKDIGTDFNHPETHSIKVRYPAARSLIIKKRGSRENAGSTLTFYVTRRRSGTLGYGSGE